MSQHQLFKKYNIPGPRYTSYPTVPYWDHSPTSEQWLQAVQSAFVEADIQNLGFALYVHLPFCESLCTYCGCNTRITRNHEVVRPYIETLLKEWELYAIEGCRDLSELHFGGGTPTFFSPQELYDLVHGLFASGSIVKKSHFEFSIEVDPRTTHFEHLAVLYQLGFRRLSLGVQDFDPEVQSIVNRVQTEAQVAALTQEARRLGFLSVNYDLIYGLPRQTLSSIQNTMEAIQRLRPDRVAFYSYAHVPWIKPGQRLFTEADLPMGEAKYALYQLGRELLETVGYLEIGLDHFALPSDSLWEAVKQKTLHRNFMGYISQPVFPLIGLGVSAIGDAWGVFSQNEKNLEKYQKRVNQGELPLLRGHVLTHEDQVLRRHILNLMTQFETDWNASELQTDYLNQIEFLLAELIQDGLVKIHGKHCSILKKGRPFLRNICMAFDARLARKMPDTVLFSRVI